MPAKKKESNNREELRNTANFFVVVAVIISIMSFVIFYKFNFLAVLDVGMPKYAFCESPVISINFTDGLKTVSCSSWIDSSPVLQKIDGASLILKRGNALVFSLDEHSSDTIRIIGNALKKNSCINIDPDYENGVYRMTTGSCSRESTVIDYTINFVIPYPEVVARLNLDSKAKMKTLLLTTFDVIEIDAVFDRETARIDNCGEISVKPSDRIQGLEDYSNKFLDVEYNASNSAICKGCLVEPDICVSVGGILDDKYCASPGNLKDKKDIVCTEQGKSEENQVQNKKSWFERLIEFILRFLHILE